MRGRVEIDTASLSDPVARRADGTWLYSLTSVIDDIEMGVSHIIRGEDHLTNSAAQIEMFESLGASPRASRITICSRCRAARGCRSASGICRCRRFARRAWSRSRWRVPRSWSARRRPSSPWQSLDALAAKIDFARISHGPARFDPADLDALTARTLHAMSFDSAAPRLEKLKVGGGRAFWEAVRGNLSRFEEAALWWRVVSEAISPALSAADLEICKSAAAALPPEPWDEATWQKANWDAFVEAIKKATGKSGRALFHPLRIALTGEERGPELRALLPFIGRARAAARLQGERA